MSVKRSEWIAEMLNSVTLAPVKDESIVLSVASAAIKTFIAMIQVIVQNQEEFVYGLFEAQK